MSQDRPKSPEAADLPRGVRVCLLATRWNREVVDRLVEGAVSRLAELGAIVDERIVPGAYELPTAAKWAAESGRFDAVVAVGCVIRGGTAHFEYVAGTCAEGLSRVAISTGVPCIFGVLTVENRQQALDRSGGDHGHAGVDAANAAVEMAALRRSLSEA